MHNVASMPLADSQHVKGVVANPGGCRLPETALADATHSTDSLHMAQRGQRQM